MYKQPKLYSCTRRIQFDSVYLEWRDPVTVPPLQDIGLVRGKDCSKKRSPCRQLCLEKGFQFLSAAGEIQASHLHVPRYITSPPLRVDPHQPPCRLKDSQRGEIDTICMKRSMQERLKAFESVAIIQHQRSFGQLSCLPWLGLPQGTLWKHFCPRAKVFCRPEGEPKSLHLNVT